MMRYKLQKLMDSKRLTYRKLSKDAGVSTSTIYNMLQDNPKPVSSEILDRLLAHFDCEPNDLIVHVKNGNAK